MRRFAKLGIVAMSIQIIGELVGAWLPRAGFAITLASSALFIVADMTLLSRRRRHA